MSGDLRVLDRITESTQRGVQLAHVSDRELARKLQDRFKRQIRIFTEEADILGEVFYRLEHGKRIQS